MTDIAAPFDAYRDVVRPEWIDSNHHMNMRYYVVVFDLATDEWFRHLGLTASHRLERRVTTFCLEAHVTYHLEVRAGDPLRFSTRLLTHDAKRIHYFHEMYHARDGYLAAANELMSLHVSQDTRRGAPMAPEILERLARVQSVHDRLPRPPQVGRVIGEEFRKRLRGAPARVQQRQVADHQAGGVDGVRLQVLGVGAGIGRCGGTLV